MKKPYSVGYFSSYDRGLECLLNLWPKIREQVPEATLAIAYGWDIFDNVHSGNPQAMQWKFKLMQRMQQDGITHHGRLSHVELAQLMQSIKVWAYPTEWTEIHCITALKVQEAGCIPITTNVAALRETVTSGVKLPTETIYTDEVAQTAFIQAVVDALSADTVPKARKPDKRYWPDVAKVWDEALTDSSSDIWKTLEGVPRDKDFDIEKYDAFYEEHYFQPLNDHQAKNAGERLARVDWAVEVAKETKPNRILDLGCLEGFTLFTIQDKLDYKLSGVGVDLSHLAIELAQRRNKKFGMDFQFLQGKIEDYMAETADKFDMITCFEVMEHVEDPLLVLQLIDRVLAPGGQVLISTPDFESPLFGKDDENNKCHIRLYTTADDDYKAANKYGHTRLATSLSKQVGKDRITDMEVKAELINCRYR